MNLQRQDFSFTYSANGYMLQYKGQDIGGAGVRLPREKPLRGNQAKSNCADFKASAERELEAILAGRGQARLLQVIARIDAESVTA